MSTNLSMGITVKAKQYRVRKTGDVRQGTCTCLIVLLFLKTRQGTCTCLIVLLFLKIMKVEPDDGRFTKNIVTTSRSKSSSAYIYLFYLPVSMKIIIINFNRDRCRSPVLQRSCSSASVIVICRFAQNRITAGWVKSMNRMEMKPC